MSDLYAAWSRWYTCDGPNFSGGFVDDGRIYRVQMASDPWSRSFRLSRSREGEELLRAAYRESAADSSMT